MLFAAMTDQQQLLLCLAGLVLGYLLCHVFPLSSFTGGKPARPMASRTAAATSRDESALVREVEAAVEEEKRKILKGRADAFVKGQVARLVNAELGPADPAPPPAAPPAAK